MSPHRYGARGCMYCQAPGSASGQPCAIAAEVEHDWTSRVAGGYDAVQHLGLLVERLHRREGGWTLEHAVANDGTPRERYTVRRGDEVIVEVQGVVRELVAREAVARLWRR